MGHSKPQTSANRPLRSQTQSRQATAKGACLGFRVWAAAFTTERRLPCLRGFLPWKRNFKQPNISDMVGMTRHAVANWCKRSSIEGILHSCCDCLRHCLSTKIVWNYERLDHLLGLIYLQGHSLPCDHYHQLKSLRLSPPTQGRTNRESLNPKP